MNSNTLHLFGKIQAQMEKAVCKKLSTPLMLPQESRGQVADNQK